jgi:glycosyltransferase involved in cell wall biosynthesis
MSSPAISVIVPCYNAAAYIEETLDSVYRQQGADFEVIVIDDGSTDGGADLVAARFPQAHLERTPNRGPSAARNLGTSLATGRYIQYLDADDLLGEDKLARQMQLLDQTEADAAYGDWIRFSANRSETISWQLGDAADIELFTVFWCPPAVYLLRRGIVDAVGGWNPSLPVIQDARFMLDCALHGARFVRCSGVMAHYRSHPAGSVSTRSGIAYWRDCLSNAIEMEQWWSGQGKLDEARRRAVATVCWQAAIASCRQGDMESFRRARALLTRLAPGDLSDRWRMRIATRLLGVGHAVSIESYLQRWKSAVWAK